jgi:hypothetical protein
MKDYMLHLYEDYMSNHCTCDRSPEECTCLSYEDFCINHMLELQDEWAQLVYETQPQDAYHA